ncbi:MAG: response regulator transcription factor [Muribaculaceae bacterium]|nr:response regulator transcription factor [Muribaculaceae bacterium]
MKLLVIDDHPAVLEGLSAVMSREGHEVLSASDCATAYDIASGNPDIDLFIADLAIKEDADGLDLVSELKRESGRPCIVYTMHGEAWNLRRLYDAGVEGIVLKGESITQLLDAVKVVAAGGEYRSPEFAARYEAVSHSNGIISARELNVLRMIGDGASSREIAQNLCLSEKAVEYHRSNILRKLGSSNMANAIRQAVRLGLL